MKLRKACCRLLGAVGSALVVAAFGMTTQAKAHVRPG